MEKPQADAGNFQPPRLQLQLTSDPEGRQGAAKSNAPAAENISLSLHFKVKRCEDERGGWKEKVKI